MNFSTNPIPKIFWSKSGKNGQNFGDCITYYIYQKKTGKSLDCADKPYTIKENFLRLIKYTLFCIGFKFSDLFISKKSLRTIAYLGINFLLSIKRVIYIKNNLEDTIYGCGSILRHSNGCKNVIIWGSGIISSKDNFSRPKKILCVRGPLTRKRFLELGYECPKQYGDPGLLLPKFHSPKSLKKFEIGVIPHFQDFEICQKIFSNLKNIKIIDVCKNIENVIDEIYECEMTISSSLHGIITSHAYGIKSCWVKFSNALEGDGIKFLDYYYSIELKDVTSPIEMDKMDFQYLNIENLKNLVNHYPNPKFPINTKKLFKTIPF